MRRTFSSSSSSSSSSSGPSLNPAATALAVATTAAAAALYFYHQHHHSPKHRQARAEERAYLDALHHIALSAGAARLGAPISPQQIDDDETRYSRRHAFFTHFFNDILGGDQKHYKFVHVTGTKGKGTVCELVRCGLIAHGKRVGTFTSPHLHTVRERIRVNDVLISKADFIRLWDKVQAALTASSSTDGGSWANFFDKVLGVALAWFVEQRVEYIILEVGIGGRYDPTNFIARPAVCVVTSVSKDHTELLGESLEAIAWQKAGILKGGGDTICLTPAAPAQDPAVLRVLQAEAEKVGCLIEEIILAPSSSPTPSPASSPTSSPTSASSSLPPSPQAPQTIRGVEVHPENFALAKGTLKTLLLTNSRGGWGGGKGKSRTMLMRRGWETKAFWPGRFELFPLRLEGGREGRWVGMRGGRQQKQRPREALLILDVAHNTDSVAKLLQEIRRRFFPGYSSTSSSSTTQRRCALWVLYGTGNDKDAQGMLDILLSNSSTSFPSSLPSSSSSSSSSDQKPLDRLIFCQAKHPRARSVDDLATFLPPSLLPPLDIPPTETRRRRRTTRRRKGEERKTEVTIPSPALGTTPDKALAQLLRDINPKAEDEDEDEDEEEEKVEKEEEEEEEEEDVVLVVCGSFFVVSAARAYLAKHRPEMLRETDWAFEADPPLYS